VKTERASALAGLAVAWALSLFVIGLLVIALLALARWTL
jgi:hypothetical protein